MIDSADAVDLAAPFDLLSLAPLLLLLMEPLKAQIQDKFRSSVQGGCDSDENGSSEEGDYLQLQDEVELQVAGV